MLRSYLAYGFILVSLIFLLPFQNFFLNKTPLGVFGSNLSLIPINLLFLMMLIVGFRFIKIYSIFFYFFYFILFVTFFSLLFTDFIVKDINIFFKSISNMVFYLQPFVVFYVFNYLFEKAPRLLGLSITASLYVFLFLLFYMILSSYEIFTLDDNVILHGFENGNSRQRLFSLESSMAVTVFITFGIIASMRYENIFFKVLIISSILYGSVLLQSKGGFVALILISIFSIKSLELSQKILFFGMLVLIVSIGSGWISQYVFSVQSGLEEYTSLSTRLTVILAAIISLFYNPLGSGFGAYLALFDHNIIEAKYFVEEMFNYFGLAPNFSEVDSYFVSSVAYSTKSMLFNSIMFFGWFGLFLFYYFHVKIYKKIGGNITVKILFLFLLIAHVFFVDSLYLYNFWFAFAFIYNYWRKDVKNDLGYSK